jgi:hypothetical protein
MLAWIAARCCDFLDKQPALVDRVRRDLMRGLKQPHHGRRGLTAAQVLRALVLMRVKNWDYRELRERIADGIALRAFANFYCEEVPKHDAFNCSFNRLTSATLKAINELVVETAVKIGVEDGSKHHGSGDRHSSPDRQHLTLGRGGRPHAAPRPACRGAGAAANRGFSRSLACCPSAHV